MKGGKPGIVITNWTGVHYPIIAVCAETSLSFEQDESAAVKIKITNKFEKKIFFVWVLKLTVKILILL